MENMQFDLLALLPELVVLGMGMFILLLDLFILPQNRSILYGLSQFTLFAAAFFTFKTHTPAVGFAFSHMFIDDTLSDVIKLMMYLGTSLIFVYTRKYLQDRNLFRTRTSDASNSSPTNYADAAPVGVIGIVVRRATPRATSFRMR